MKGKDLTGLRFGKLTVISKAPYKHHKNGRKRAAWNCLCDCGNEKVVLTENLVNGHVSSCGCKKEKHSMSYSRLYSIWNGMKDRCNNPHHKFYSRYGGRGISVCEDWQTDFNSFMNWSYANGYEENLTIDRIDNDKGYTPDNCRWATMKVQRNNASSNKILSFNGRTMNVTKWANELNISRHTLYTRLRKGWSVEKALTTPRRNIK